MSDELEVLLKKCEWVTQQTSRTPDKFITIAISLFVPILIALGLALKDPSHFQLLFFFIPWFTAIFISMAAYIMYGYRGLVISNSLFERRIDAIIKQSVFIYAQRFGQNYFDRFRAIDPIMNKKVMTPLLPLLCLVIAVITMIDAICVVQITKMNFYIFQWVLVQQQSIMIKWIYCVFVTICLLIIPIYFVMRSKSKYRTLAKNIVSHINSQFEIEKKLST